MKVENAKGANRDLIIDLYKHPDTELRDHVQGWIQKGLKLTIDHFQQAQEKGCMRKDLQPTLMLVILDKMQEIVIDDRLQSTYPNMEALTSEISKFFLYGIFDER
jgi:hypothetical protein